MLQLKNRTPFNAGFTIFPNEDAIDTLYVMVKATFNIGHKWELAEEQKPLTEADEYFGEPGLSSLKYPSDYHTGKPTTDIIMLGSACTIDRQAVRQMDVRLQVGEQQKTIRVFGERFWQQGQISTPEPFETMRLRYENAFGGQDIHEQSVRTAEARNLVGKGFRGKKSSHEMNGVELPNLEDPSNLIQSPSDTPQPFCFAPVAPNWSPRKEFAGTYDQQWETEQAPYLPVDYSSKFMNCASHGMSYPSLLQGGERVIINGMHPAGVLDFELPYVNLCGAAKISNTNIPLMFELETLSLEPNQLSLSLNWRAKLICEKKIPEIEEITVNLSKT